MNDGLRGIKKFAFFEIEKPEKVENQECLEISLNDIIPISLRIFDKFYYVAGKLNKAKDSKPFKIFQIHPNGKIIKQYTPFTDCILDFDISKSEDKAFLVVLGTDPRNEAEKSSAKAEIKGVEEINRIIVTPSKDSIPSIKFFDLTNLETDEIGVLKPNYIIYLMHKKEKLTDFYKGDNLTGLTNVYFPITEITCFSVTSILNAVAFAFYNNVIEIKLDFNNKKDKFKAFLVNSQDKKSITNITNIKYIFNQEFYLYFSTNDFVYYKRIGETKPSTVGNDYIHSGADPHNFDVNSNRNLVVTTSKNNYIEEYDYIQQTTTYEKLYTKIFGRTTRCIQLFRNLFVFVLYEGKDTKDKKQILCIYDPKNNIFDTFDETFGQKNKDILFIISNEERIYILYGDSSSKNIICLKECDEKKKIDTFYDKKLFDIAYAYGKNMGYDKEKLADVAKAYAEFFFEKGDFERSIEQYKLTINYLDPNYVIKKFLDEHKNFLIEYLEELQVNKEFKRKLNNDKRFKDFTALLLNIYIQQKRIDKLENFILKQKINDDATNKTIIEVCVDTNNIDLALTMAKKVKMNDMYIQILIELKKDFNASLKYINEIKELKPKFKILMNYGRKLLEEKTISNEADKTINKLIDEIIYIKRGNPEDKKLDNLKYEQIISIYISKENEDKLEQLLNKFMNEDPDCPQQIIIRSIEFYINRYKEKEKNKSGNENARKIKEIMSKFKNKLDKNYLLMLFKISGFDEGIAELSKIMELDQDLLSLYMERQDYQKINEFCRKNKEKDKKTNYWLQALNFYIDVSNKSNNKEISANIIEVLDNLSTKEEFSPMNLLDILEKASNDQNKVIEIKEIRKYFKDWIKHKKESLKDDKIETEENYKKIEEYDKNIKDIHMSAKKFDSYSTAKCYSCKGSLDMPFVFFICGHGYHQSCLDEVNNKYECSVCKDRNGKYFHQIEDGEKYASEPDKYQEELKKEKQNKFDVFANFLGKGVFTNGNSLNNKEYDNEN